MGTPAIKRRKKKGAPVIRSHGKEKKPSTLKTTYLWEDAGGSAMEEKKKKERCAYKEGIFLAAGGG